MELDDYINLEFKNKNLILSSFICDLQNSTTSLHKQQPNINFITLGCKDGIKIYPNLTQEQILKCKKILDIVTDNDDYILKEIKQGQWITGKF